MHAATPRPVTIKCCFTFVLQVFRRNFAKNKTSQEPKRLQNRVCRLVNVRGKIKPHIDDKSSFICEKCDAKIHGIVKHIILFTLQAMSLKLQLLIVI